MFSARNLSLASRPISEAAASAGRGGEESEKGSGAVSVAPTGRPASSSISSSGTSPALR